jgi:hypothetical protein
MPKILCLIVSALLVAPWSRGADRFVTTTGRADADGSIADPWSIAKAFGHGMAPGAQPGDTVWIRGGTYSGSFEIHASGSAASPIIFRAYPGERVRFDGGSDGRYTLNAIGDFLWFWGLEVYSSDVTRLSKEAGSFPSDILRGPEAGATAPASRASSAREVRFINMVLHDGWGSFGAHAAQNLEFYGNIIFHDGWDGTDRGHGHSLYLQNGPQGIKRVGDNILFGAFGYGLHIYSEDDWMQGFHIEGNVAFEHGQPSSSGYSKNYWIGAGDRVNSGDQVKNIVFTNNFSFFSPSTDKDAPDGIGLHFGSGQEGCSNATITNNFLVSQGRTAAQLEGGEACRPVMTGNTYVGATGGFGPAIYPGNTYYPEGSPKGSNVFVRPNRYERGRAHIIIYNWDLLESLQVDLSGLLKVGDAFEIRDAQNYLGRPLLRSRFDGAPITLPMTDTSVEPLVGFARRTVRHTGSQFGVFVLLPLVQAPVRLRIPNRPIDRSR